MIGAKALAEAQMDLAGATDVVCSMPIFRPVAAVLTVSLLRSELRAVNRSGCMRRRWMPSMLAWPVFGW